MLKEVTQEDMSKIKEILTSMNGGKSVDMKTVNINKIRVCDNCMDETKEAFPYYVNDRDQKFWEHLCNECFDSLGCVYIYEADFPPQCCEHCGKDIDDFSDLGCEFCDSRYTEIGVEMFDPRSEIC